MERCCVDCNIVIGGKKKLRCQQCIKTRTNNYKKTHLYKLYTKWYSMCKRRYPMCLQLANGDIVRSVFLRWEGKSVISGERDAELLTIAPYYMTDCPTQNDLVLITNAELKLLNQAKTEARRIAFFPEIVQRKINNRL